MPFMQFLGTRSIGLHAMSKSECKERSPSHYSRSQHSTPTPRACPVRSFNYVRYGLARIVHLFCSQLQLGALHGCPRSACLQYGNFAHTGHRIRMKLLYISTAANCRIKSCPTAIREQLPLWSLRWMRTHPRVLCSLPVGFMRSFRLILHAH